MEKTREKRKRLEGRGELERIGKKLERKLGKVGQVEERRKEKTVKEEGKLEKREERREKRKSWSKRAG